MPILPHFGRQKKFFNSRHFLFWQPPIGKIFRVQWQEICPISHHLRVANALATPKFSEMREEGRQPVIARRKFRASRRRSLDLVVANGAGRTGGVISAERKTCYSLLWTGRRASRSCRSCADCLSILQFSCRHVWLYHHVRLCRHVWLCNYRDIVFMIFAHWEIISKFAFVERTKRICLWSISVVWYAHFKILERSVFFNLAFETSTLSRQSRVKQALTSL